MSRTPKREQIVRAKLRITRIAPRETASGLRPNARFTGLSFPMEIRTKIGFPQASQGKRARFTLAGFFFAGCWAGCHLGSDDP